jgi:hypothetical protein
MARPRQNRVSAPKHVQNKHEIYYMLTSKSQKQSRKLLGHIADWPRNDRVLTFFRFSYRGFKFVFARVIFCTNTAYSYSLVSYLIVREGRGISSVTVFFFGGMKRNLQISCGMFNKKTRLMRDYRENLWTFSPNAAACKKLLSSADNLGKGREKTSLIIAQSENIECTTIIAVFFEYGCIVCCRVLWVQRSSLKPANAISFAFPHDSSAAVKCTPGAGAVIANGGARSPAAPHPAAKD